MIPLTDNIKNRTFPLVNLLLIAANIAAFVYELSSARGEYIEQLIMSWGVVPSRLLAYPWSEWITLFTSMFLHGGWSHIIGNMVYLWVFGDNVEDRLGHFRYLVFYLLTGIAAAVTQVYFHPHSRIPMVGASGAIAGVMGAFFILYPGAKVMTLVPIWIFLRVVEVPGVFFLGFWFVIQYIQGLGSISHHTVAGDAGSVAWWAHAGGFLAGIVLVFVLRKKRRR
jgi:membrane associated rhomboid family serine protease